MKIKTAVFYRIGFGCQKVPQRVFYEYIYACIHSEHRIDLLTPESV